MPAHEDISMAATSLDEWICVANSVADRAAKAANRNRMGNFWTLWERHVGQTLKMRILGGTDPTPHCGGGHAMGFKIQRPQFFSCPASP